MALDLFSGFFSDPAQWTVFASGQSEATLHRDTGPDGSQALRMDYDFHGGRGFVVARREVRFALPEVFQFGFFLRGHGLANHLEFKVIDPGGSNVWRYLREDYPLPEDWRAGRITERNLLFAWGPAGGGAPKVAGAIELAIVAGPGGRGSVWFSDLLLEDQTMYLPKEITASSALPTSPPEAVFETGSPSGWRAERGDTDPWWQVDFGHPQRFGGLVLGWPVPMPPRAFRIEISDDGEAWREIHHTTRALGRHSHIASPGAEARHLRIHFANVKSAALAKLTLRPDSFSHKPNDFVHAVAQDYPRGWFPRYWYHEQSYWTPVGSPEGRRRALVNEEGMVETDEAGFSLEPFLLIGNRLITWADAQIQIALQEDGLPLPEVTWFAEDVELKILPWVDCAGDRLVLRTTYQVRNRSGRRVRLAVAARPYQVNPPWQTFRDLGGISPIHEIQCTPDGITLPGRQVLPDVAAHEFGAATFEEEGVVSFLSQGLVPPRAQVNDETGLASAVLAWDLGAGDSGFEVTLSVPFFSTPGGIEPGARGRVAEQWRQVLSAVRWQAPAIAKPAIDCFRTAAGHILINRDGAAIQPGPRRYTRSWVRDCVIMGAAMAKAGQPQVLRKFVKWYVKFQREDGFVPCVVDRDGIDWLVEHDSHGQLVWGICEVFRNEGDKELLASLWPHVKAAADFMVTLRTRTMSSDCTESQRSLCHGLFPESASHEGYLAHPVHSYWDDFWGVRGLEAAAEIARELGHADDAARWHGDATAFLADLLDSIRGVIETRNIAYVPGSVEWADFDPTATANAIAQLDFADDLPAGPLESMLDTYLEGFRDKHYGSMPWVNYTAYEIRIIGAFVRLGRRDEALELLEFFLSDRRPRAWNQWPEISWRDPRSPGHLGDVPHTWIAAEYMLALGSMVASERESDESMVLAAGLPWAWIREEEGFAVRGLRVRFGSLDFHLHASAADRIRFSIGGGISLPPGGLSIAPPLPDGLEIAGATGSGDLEVAPDRRSVIITRLPQDGEIRLAARLA